MQRVTKYSYVLSSQKKLALVAKMISGKSVESALELLNFLPNKVALTISKVIKTAVNNIKQGGNSTQGLYIQRYDLGQGPKLKRMRAVGRSRMHGYYKHRAFFAVYISNV